jgi:hypothetical protein
VQSVQLVTAHVSKCFVLTLLQTPPGGAPCRGKKPLSSNLTSHDLFPRSSPHPCWQNNFTAVSPCCLVALIPSSLGFNQLGWLSVIRAENRLRSGKPNRFAAILAVRSSYLTNRCWQAQSLVSSPCLFLLVPYMVDENASLALAIIRR